MVNLIFCFYGLFSLLSQLLLFRELSIIFYGSELFLGLALSSWLFWVGCGSFLVLKVPEISQKFRYSFALGLGGVSLLLPMEIIFIRLSKGLFPFGILLGPLAMTFFIFFSLSIFGLLLGGLFTLACGMVSALEEKKAAGRVYFWENTGAITSGLVFTWWLVGKTAVFTISLGLSLAGLGISLFLLSKERRRFNWRIVSLLIIFLGLMGFRPGWERLSRQTEWRGYELLSQTESPYGHLALARLGSLNNLFENGLISGHFPDPGFYEELAHWPLLAHGEPRQVLVLGGGATGLLSEMLKHSPQGLDYLELDRKVIDLIRPYLSPGDRASLKDKRVHLHHLDGRVWIRSKKNLYDVIILNLPEPATGQINRYYTEEFYREVRESLSPDGLLAFSLPSAENYLKPEIESFNASIYGTIRRIFPKVYILPGDNLIFLAGRKEINLEEGLLTSRYLKRKLENKVMVPSYFRYKLSPERRRYVEKKLTSSSGLKGGLALRTNQDFSPISYYYFGKMWLGKFSSPSHFLWGLLILIGLGWLFRELCQGRLWLKHRLEKVIFIIGLSGMLMELVLILSFAALGGCIYWQMGMLFASFMAGLALGSGLGRKLNYLSLKASRKVLLGLLLGLIILSLTFSWQLPWLRGFSERPLGIMFGLMILSVGIVVGMAFPLASYLSLTKGDSLENLGDSPAKMAGRLYAADLWGASLGAIAGSVWLIPLLGFKGIFYLVALLGMVGVLILSKT